jgi:hypothetical protein
MELNTTYYNNNSRIVTGTPIVYQDDVILLCNTSTGPVTINLLQIPDNQWLTTYKLYVIDNSSNASINNITINAGIGQTINNQSSIVISTNGECTLVRIVGNSQYILTSTNLGNSLDILEEGVLLTSNASSINFTGSGVTATNIGNNVTVNVPIQQAYTTVRDESTILPQRNTLVFVGAGVTATDTGTNTVVAIPGGLSQAYEFTQDEGVTLPQRNTIDFQGAGVTATDNGSKTIVTIPGATTTTLAVTDTPTIDLTLTGGPAYNLQADITDSGWQNLDGFDFYTGGFQKPQCRKIGKVIHFRGVVFVPLSSDGGPTAIPISSSTSYYTQNFKNPWTGTGGGYGNGVTLDPFGGVQFNKNLPLIPSSVLPLATNLDSAYSAQRIGLRVIQIQATYTTAYSAYLSVAITSDKRLLITTLKDVEEGDGYNLFHPSSPLRFITSYTRSTDNLPIYNGSGTFIHNSNVTDPFDLTSNRLSTNTWPIALDAAEETDIGGFQLRLDGLMAFI